MKIYVIALCMAVTMAKACELSQSPEVPYFYNPYSLQKIAALKIIYHIAQASMKSECKANLMNREKTNLDLLNYITQVVIDHGMSDGIVKKIEFYFSRLPTGKIRDTLQQKMVWHRTVETMTQGKNTNLPILEKCDYDDIGGQTIYDLDLQQKECVIPGKKRIYIYNLSYRKPILVDSTMIGNEGEYPIITACALYTYYNRQTKLKKRTVVFGTNDGEILIHPTGPMEMLCAPLGLPITKIVYDINADKNEINKIGLITQDEHQNSHAFITIEDDHPQEKGEWFKGSTLWAMPIKNITSLIFKNSFLFAYTPTSWSAWKIEKVDDLHQICQVIPTIFDEKSLTGEEDTYQTPPTYTRVVESKKIDHTLAPAFAELAG